MSHGNLIKTTSLPLEWRYPAEWESHKAVWLAWPYHRELWEENLNEAQKEFINLVLVLSKNEHVKLLCHNDEAKHQAQTIFKDLNTVSYHMIPYGDIWVRDTGCLFFKNKKNSELCAKLFSFNGWGSKYEFPEDPHIAKTMAEMAHCKSHQIQSSEWIVEGGALEWDGEGNVLTTRQCLQNKNRHHPLKDQEKTFEDFIMAELGVQKVGWISEGLLNDHTDGHIDTIARFIAPGVVVCMESMTSGDPQKEKLKNILSDLKKIRLANGSKLEIFTIPSPGAILSSEGDVMPASYMNFYLANNIVAVPTYQSKYDDRATLALESLIKNRSTIPLKSLAILSGGGSFHCITQQEPA